MTTMQHGGTSNSTSDESMQCTILRVVCASFVLGRTKLSNTGMRRNQACCGGSWAGGVMW